MILGGRNLHVIDVIPVPDRLEDSVGDPEDKNVLHRLFAQVMIDAKDLLFFEDTGLTSSFKPVGEARSCPKGFSDQPERFPAHGWAIPARPGGQ